MPNPYRSPTDAPRPRRSFQVWRIVLVIAAIGATAMLGSLKYAPGALFRSTIYIAAVALLLTSLALLFSWNRRER